MEVCVDSVASARNAEKGGAARLELCASLVEGGTTPSCGMLQVMKRSVALPVFVMIRPRGGDFLYSPDEFDVMKQDITSLKQAGADGMVFGILTPEGKVDITRCKELVELSRPLPITFHRAIDMTEDIAEALESIIATGCERILTSGGEGTSVDGTTVIKQLVSQAKGRILVVPGGGITPENLGRILDETGAGEFHGTARGKVESKMKFRKSGVTMGSAGDGTSEFAWKESSADIVRLMITVAKEHGICTGSKPR
ncbi:copper homeostasis protein cutC homolog [Liolophura sinensis]|uniref:copper homeostasis protein cutC homolog n=1 Tax=Liolophura sinensis TaxID=3198878 RepID=UPI0031590C78